MWCIWMFCRVVMWPLRNGTYLSIPPANASSWSGRDAAERQLDPHHLHVRLALPVDALLEAELDEVVLLQLTLEVARRLGIEVVELPLQDRDHVTRDVLDHLRVLE